MDPTCSPGKGKIKSAVDEIVGRASEIQFTEEKFTRQEGIGRRDYDEIEERMSREELQELENHLDETKTEIIDQYVNDFEPYIDEGDIIRDADLRDKDINAEVERLIEQHVEDEELQTKLKELNDEWYQETSEYGLDAIDEVEKVLRDDAPDSLLEAMRTYRDNSESKLDAAREEEEERQRDEYREEVERGYSPDSSERHQYLREFYDRNSEEPRFAGSSEKTPDRTWGRDEDNDRILNFETTGGDKFEIMAYQRKIQDTTVMDVSFSDENDSYEITGKQGAKGAVEVFRTVSASVVAIVQKDNPDSLMFTAAEESRQSLYDKLTKTVTKVAPGYAAVAITKPGASKTYLVAKRELLPSLTEKIKEYVKSSDVKIEQLVNMKGPSHEQERTRSQSREVATGVRSGVANGTTLAKGNRRATTKNPLRADPTRTATLRRQFENEMVRRFVKFRQKLVSLIVDEDAFGLKQQNQSLVPTVNSSFSSTQLNVTDPECLRRIRELQGRLDPTDVIELEDQPHVTVRFGLHSQDAETVQKLVKDTGPIWITLGRLSLFQQPEHDVLKLDVQSKGLERLNTELGKLPNTTTHDNYEPHLTIAYLKPGTGWKYLQDPSFLEWQSYVFTDLTFSDMERNHTELALNVFCPTGEGGGVDPSCRKASLSIDPHTVRSGGSTIEELRARMGEDSNIIEGRIAGIPITTSERGLIEKLTKKTKSQLEAAFSDPEIIKAMELGRLHTIQVRPTNSSAKLGGPKEWTAAHTSGVLIIHPKTGDVIDKSAIAERKEYGLKRVIYHEVGHAVWDTASDQMKETFRAELAKSPDVTEHIAKLVSVVANPNAFSNTGSRLVTESFAELSAIKHYDKERFAALTPELRSSVDTAHSFAERFIRPKHLATNEHTLNTRWAFRSSPEKIKEFLRWLEGSLRPILTDEATTDDDWWNKYIQMGFKKGAARSYDDMKKAGAIPQSNLPFYLGQKDEFLRSAFRQPESVEKVKLLAGRVYTELKGVTEAMSQNLTRTLTDGLTQGMNPRQIAINIVKDVENIGIKRARVITRTEIIRAHAEGQLDSMERLSVKRLAVMVEWNTAEDDRVCKLCAPLHGIVVTIDEAKGLIPRHPQCRCAFVPANVGEDQTEQVRGAAKIKKAITKSLIAGKPKRGKSKSSWAGAKRKINSFRPKSRV